MASPAEPAKGDESVERDALTPREMRCVLQHVAIDLMGNLTWALMDTALNIKLLRIANGDVVALAKANTWHWSINGAMQLFVRPVGAALSDTLGRKWFIVINRLSMVTYFAGSFLSKSLNQYIMACILCFGCLWPLTGSAQAASWSDLFGSRPELSARVRAKYTGFSQAVMGFVAPALGAVITSYHATAGFYLAMAGCFVQAGIACTMDETLKKEDRKPFSLAVANPISNALLLFTNGPGLRGLAISHAWFDIVGTIWSTMEPYRLGYIGWSPANQSFYHSFMSGINIFVNKFVSQVKKTPSWPRSWANFILL
jgi:MFS family permease